MFSPYEGASRAMLTENEENRCAIENTFNVKITRADCIK